MKKRNYHMCITRTADSWRCDYCGDTDPDPNVLRTRECTHVYEVCKIYGGSDESNECRPDCRGVLEVLGKLIDDPDVYVIGKVPR